MRRPFAAAALLCAVFSAAAPAGAASVRVEGDALVFEGRIDLESGARFVELLQAPQVRRVVITSAGGLVNPALDMAEAMLGRGLDVEVPAQCRSSCANYIFPAGRRKRIGSPTAVAWHGNMAHVLYLDARGEGGWNEVQMQGARYLAAREAAFYERAGVDGLLTWFGKLPPFDVPDFYAVTPAIMAGFGVREVTVEGGAPDDGVVLVDFSQPPPASPSPR